MKKLSFFAVALALTAFVACDGNKEKKDDDMMDEDMTERVDMNASDNMRDANNDGIEDLTVEEEVFGTNISDEKADGAL